MWVFNVHWVLQPVNIKYASEATCSNQACVLNCVANVSFYVALLHIFSYSSAFFMALVWCIRRERGTWSTTTWPPTPADRSTARYSLIWQPFSIPRHQKLKHGQAPLVSLLWRQRCRYINELGTRFQMRKHWHVVVWFEQPQ